MFKDCGMNYRAKEEAKRHQELMENREKERREIRRQEVELIKEVYPTSVLFSYSSFNTLIYKLILFIFHRTIQYITRMWNWSSKYMYRIV